MSETVFLRLVSQNDKASALAEATNTIREGLSSSLTHMVNPVSFRQIPGSPFSYWVSEPMRRIFTKFPSFEGEGRMVRQGGVTGDDARYLRSYWEVNPAHLNQGNVAWVPFAKGGRYSPYWRDLSVVVHWDFTRGTFYGYTGLLHRPSEKPSSADLYFLRGLTWPLRAARFAPIPLPERSIFSIRGYAIIAPPNELPWLLA